MPLASYFLVVGIFFSAISVAQAVKIRNYVLKSTKSVEMQLDFLRSIGSSEMEQEIQKKVQSITKSSAEKLEEDSGIPTSLDDSNIKEYITTVIREKRAHV